jgi:hypothetical protein
VGGGTYDASTGTYTVPSAGVYLVSTIVGLSGNATASGNRCVVVFFDTTVDGAACSGPAAGLTAMSTTHVASLAAGATISVGVQNNTTVATTTSDAATAVLSIVRLH